VCLHVAPATSNVVLDLARRSVESVTQYDVEIRVRAVRGRVAGDGDFSRGHRDVDTHGKEPALRVMPVRNIQRDVTSSDPVVESLEPRSTLTNGFLDCG
jgi:hypothetical protein